MSFIRRDNFEDTWKSYIDLLNSIAKDINEDSLYNLYRIGIDPCDEKDKTSKKNDDAAESVKKSTAIRMIDPLKFKIKDTTMCNSLWGDSMEVESDYYYQIESENTYATSLNVLKKVDDTTYVNSMKTYSSIGVYRIDGNKVVDLYACGKFQIVYKEGFFLLADENGYKTYSLSKDIIRIYSVKDGDFSYLGKGYVVYLKDGKIYVDNLMKKINVGSGIECNNDVDIKTAHIEYYTTSDLVYKLAIKICCFGFDFIAYLGSNDTVYYQYDSPKQTYKSTCKCGEECCCDDRCKCHKGTYECGLDLGELPVEEDENPKQSIYDDIDCDKIGDAIGDIISKMDPDLNKKFAEKLETEEEDGEEGEDIAWTESMGDVKKSESINYRDILLSKLYKDIYGVELPKGFFDGEVDLDQLD